MWYARRCAVRVPTPGRRVSCATRFPTAGPNTPPLCLCGVDVPSASELATAADAAAARERKPAAELVGEPLRQSDAAAERPGTDEAERGFAGAVERGGVERARPHVGR